MTSILNAVGNLIGSVFEVFKSIFDTAFSALQSVFAVFTSALSSVFSILTTLLKDVGHLFEGLVEFIMANFVILALVAGGAIGFVVYQQRQGKPVTAGKKKA